MKSIIALCLCLFPVLDSFSQIVKVTEDTSNDFSIALSYYYLAINKYNSETLNEEVYVYDIYDLDTRILVHDGPQTYLCDAFYDYILFGFENNSARILYYYDAYQDIYNFVDTTSFYNFSSIYDNQVLYARVPDNESDTHIFFYYGGEIIDLGINNENLFWSDQANFRSVWAGSNMYYFNGSSVTQMNDAGETPRGCQVSNSAAAWVSSNSTTGDVFVHYIDGSSENDVIINPNGYGNWNWFDLSESNLVWLDEHPSGGVTWFNGSTNTKIWNANDLPVESNCSIDGNDIVFGGYGVIYHFDITSDLITTFLLGDGRIASNLTINNEAIAWTENTGQNREVYFAFLDDLTIIDERFLDIDQNTSKVNLLYPNPTGDILRLKEVFTESIPYYIVDITGKVVMKGMIDQNNEIHVKSLSSGTYLLHADELKYKFVKE